MFDQLKKRDWVFVAVCIAGALLFGAWSVQMGVAYHRSQHGPTDLSSSNRRGGDAPSPTAPAPAETDNADAPTRPAR
ncbi:hypothetical protein AS156_39790 [Bradyrhizobium macuxiense]|uniref:Uncharacterized protein n=1 Tax=Bradyrhizobium macuxiense TaxID=1755647 RepID=A0A109JYL8_9BRAD|nr:hypothetical protein AS156_39790 [Bradyrhizobium macuxiense]